MRIPVFLSLFFLLQVLPAGAQSRWATAVFSHQFNSTQQSIGQDAAYFPANVLGPVANNISPTSPASRPEDVVSIGKGGHIALEFNPPLRNGPGMDFTVFENVLVPLNGGPVFDEWLIVSVSNDGVNWYTFAYDTLTGAGMAGRTPTAATGADYHDPSQSGGDSYDLTDVGLETARYVRVEDATRYQDALRLAAELDAVAAIHQVTSVENALNTALLSLERQGLDWVLELGPDIRWMDCVDLAGRTLELPHWQEGSRVVLHLAQLPRQVAILRFRTAAGLLTRKVLLGA